MKILTFSDWRVQPLSFIDKFLGGESPDAIMYAGDDLDRLVTPSQAYFADTKHGRIQIDPSTNMIEFVNDVDITHSQKSYLKKRIQHHIDYISKNNHLLSNLYEIPFYCVNGNDDIVIRFNGKEYLQINIDERLIHSIYIPTESQYGSYFIEGNGDTVSVFGSKCTYGLGSSVIDPPDEYADIYLSHVPPLGRLDLSSRFGLEHIGSDSLMTAVKEYQPRIVICGHSHIWGGMVDSIGDTRVLNISSSDLDASTGNYAIIDTGDWTIKVRQVSNKAMRSIMGSRTIQKSISEIRSNVLEREEDERIYDEKRREYNRYLGYLDPKRDDISPEERLDQIEEIEVIGLDVREMKERIESLSWDKPKLKQRFTLDPKDMAYLDVETGRSAGLVDLGQLWLIGVYYRGKIFHFQVPDELEIFKQFLNEQNIKKIVTWTQYDIKVLYRHFSKEELGIKFIDAEMRAYNSLIWHTFRLSDLYHDLLPNITILNGEINGYMAGLYADHLFFSVEKCPLCPEIDDVIDRIKSKNTGDLVMLRAVCEELWKMNELFQ